MKSDKDSLTLYAVTDRTHLGGRTLESCVEEAICGGASFVQLREKELKEKELISEAKKIKEVCLKYNVPFVINDNVKVAMEIDADGVHVGQSDMRADNVRALIGKDKILGVSVQTVEQAVFAEKCGADYLGVGSVFYTSSKSDAESVSFKTLEEICKSVNIPVIAIGGINSENVLKLSGSGICGIAVISALFSAQNIKKAAYELKKLIKKVVENA